jgi:BioD-like phosphotransacetylase family protein
MPYFYSMNNPLSVYVSATGQNDGKTTSALGLYNALHEFYPKIGYIKPVGQQVIQIDDHQIDKDVTLMAEIFQIGDKLSDMSPVAIPKGFTENYIEHGDTANLHAKISESYQGACADKDFMVIEGTGHAGVGSVIDLSNADVASLLKSPVIIVSGGGIGRPIDEIMLNKALFDNRGVDILGVIVNKVKPEKYDKINSLIRKGLKNHGLDVLGVIPFFPDLSSPTMFQLMEEIDGNLVCGEHCLDNKVTNVIVGAMPPHTALDYFKGDVLLITPGNREDLILAAIASSVFEQQTDYSIRGIILTGGIKPQATILDLIRRFNVPVIEMEEDTFSAARRLTNLIIKIRPGDTEKIHRVKEMILEYVDIDTLLGKIKKYKK